MARKLLQQALLTLTMLITLGLSGCAGLTYHADPLNVTLTNIQLLDAQLLEQEYLLTLRVQNTNDSPLVINGLSYTLDINGNEFAKGVNNQQNHILPFSEKLIQVSLISSTFNAIKQLKILNNKSKPSFSYRLKGKVSLGARYVPTPLIPLTFEASGAINLGLPATKPLPINK